MPYNLKHDVDIKWDISLYGGYLILTDGADVGQAGDTNMYLMRQKLKCLYILTLFSHIISRLFTNFVRSRWLDIGLVLLLQIY